LGTPFFLVFGSLSDKIGRKKIILTGCLLAGIFYFPLFKALTHFTNPKISMAQANYPIEVITDGKDCHFQFDPIGSAKFLSSCDIAKSSLAKKGVSYTTILNHNQVGTTISIGSIGLVSSFDGTQYNAEELELAKKNFDQSLKENLDRAGYPSKADPKQINYVMTILILTTLVIFVTMVYGPIAAYLVELFPTKIRYTSMSLPYHIGNGWFGGFLPTVSFAMVSATGNMYSGLWYPIIIAFLTVIIGFFSLPETKDWDLHHHDR
jgi:MFS family permease